MYDWERTAKQRLMLDVTLHTDLSQAAMSDKVADTIDYAKVAALLAEVADDSQFELLEALGHRLICELFERFALSKVNLTLSKPDILPNAQRVSIQMERTASVKGAAQ